MDSLKNDPFWQATDQVIAPNDTAIFMLSIDRQGILNQRFLSCSSVEIEIFLLLGFFQIRYLDPHLEMLLVHCGDNR